MSELEHILKQVTDLEIKSRRFVRELLPGIYNSKIRGKGLDFYHLREYLLDDDIRDIDWNVTARLGVPHIKEFIEDRQLNVYTIVDFSPSMFFGKSKSKKQMILEIVASILFSSVKNGDPDDGSNQSSGTFRRSDLSGPATVP